MRYVESLNQGLHYVMEEDDRVYFIGEDVLDPYGGAFKVAKGLSERFPDRVLSTPISEAAIVGFATGMAMQGMRPIVEIMFGDFITLAADQIINHAVKFRWMYNQQVKVPLVIRTPMGGRRGYGPTHSQTIEQIFMGFAGLSMIAPSHLHVPGELLRQALMDDDVTLFIENKSLYAQRLTLRHGQNIWNDFHVQYRAHTDQRFPTVALSMERFHRADVALIGYGGMSPLMIEAAQQVFMEDEIVVEVVIPSLIKPWPVLDVQPSVERARRVVVVEEGSKECGWGAELASRIYESSFATLLASVTRIGTLGYPIPSAGSLEEKMLPQVSDIVLEIKKVMNVPGGCS